MCDDWLAAADAAENAARVIAGKAGLINFIPVFAAFEVNHAETVPDFDAFHRVDAHQRMRQIRIQTIKDRFTQTRRDVFRHNRDFRTDGISLFFQAAQ